MVYYDTKDYFLYQWHKLSLPKYFEELEGCYLKLNQISPIYISGNNVLMIQPKNKIFQIITLQLLDYLTLAAAKSPYFHMTSDHFAFNQGFVEVGHWDKSCVSIMKKCFTDRAWSLLKAAFSHAPHYPESGLTNATLEMAKNFRIKRTFETWDDMSEEMDRIYQDAMGYDQ